MLTVSNLSVTVDGNVVIALISAEFVGSLRIGALQLLSVALSYRRGRPSNTIKPKVHSISVLTYKLGVLIV